MARLVGRKVPRPERAPGAGASPPPPPNPEPYLERVTKYVPVEIVAAYVTISGLLPQHGTPGAIPVVAEVAIFVALVVFTPLYLLRFTTSAPGKNKQVSVATVSFLIWTYAISGAQAGSGSFFWGTIDAALGPAIVHPALGSALLVLWSLAAALIDPEQ